MPRREYYHDDTVPPANSMTPTAFAAVRDDQRRVLLVRRSDSGNWELPGGRVELSETPATAARREVVEESGITIKVTRLAGIYTDPGHVMVYPATGEARQQFSVCVHALPVHGQPHPDHEETCEAALDRPRPDRSCARLARAVAPRQSVAVSWWVWATLTEVRDAGGVGIGI